MRVEDSDSLENYRSAGVKVSLAIVRRDLPRRPAREVKNKQPFPKDPNSDASGEAGTIYLLVSRSNIDMQA